LKVEIEVNDESRVAVRLVLLSLFSCHKTGTVTGLHDCTFLVRIPAMARELLFLQVLQTGTGTRVS